MRQLRKDGEVEFRGYRCGADEGRYAQRAGGSRAIVLVAEPADPEDPPTDANEPIAVATVNVSGVSEVLPDDHVVLKDYSGNEGMMAALVAAGIVEDTGERVSFGYVSAPIGRLLV